MKNILLPGVRRREHKGKWRRERGLKGREGNIGGTQGHKKGEDRRKGKVSLTSKAKAHAMVGLIRLFAGPAGDLLRQGCWSWKAEFPLFLKTFILVFQPTHLV